jgi:hypothetical protein
MKLLPTCLRLVAVAAVGFFSLASSTPSNEPRYGEGQDPYGQQHQNEYSQIPPGVWSCYALKSQSTEGSLCFGSRDRCDRDREAAAHDGAQVSDCRPLAPVSCFQSGGNPNPANEVCAATPKDCDLWRQLDSDQNSGAQNGSCEWRHAVAQQGQGQGQPQPRRMPAGQHPYDTNPPPNPQGPQQQQQPYYQQPPPSQQ